MQALCVKNYIVVVDNSLPPPRRLCFYRSLSVCMLVLLLKKLSTYVDEKFKIAQH